MVLDPSGKGVFKDVEMEILLMDTGRTPLILTFPMVLDPLGKDCVKKVPIGRLHNDTGTTPLILTFPIVFDPLGKDRLYSVIWTWTGFSGLLLTVIKAGTLILHATTLMVPSPSVTGKGLLNDTELLLYISVEYTFNGSFKIRTGYPFILLLGSHNIRIT